MNVHGGASKNDDGVPELGKQKPPAGSAGSQPAAGTPASENENCNQLPNGIAPAYAGAERAKAAATTISRCAAKLATFIGSHLHRLEIRYVSIELPEKVRGENRASDLRVF